MSDWRVWCTKITVGIAWSLYSFENTPRSEAGRSWAAAGSGTRRRRRAAEESWPPCSYRGLCPLWVSYLPA